MAIFRLNAAAQNAACDAIVDLIDVGGTGTIVVRSTPQPAVGAAATGTVLATITCAATAFGAAAAGVATAGTFVEDASVIGGTAAWARMYNGTASDPADSIFDMDAGVGTETLVFTPTNVFVTDGTANISSMTVTVPAE